MSPRYINRSLSHTQINTVHGRLGGVHYPLYPLKTEKTLSHYMLEGSSFDFMHVRLYDLDIPTEKMVKLFANSVARDQTPRSVASDLGLHCFPVTRLGVFSLQWFKDSLDTENTY